MSDTPLTDTCFKAAQALIAKYGTRDGVGPEFHTGNPWLLARALERQLAEAQAEIEKLRERLGLLGLEVV